VADVTAVAELDDKPDTTDAAFEPPIEGLGHAVAVGKSADEPDMSSSPPPNDLVGLVLEDHAMAKSLFDRIDDPDANLSALFAQIVKALAVHEVAEEEILYPAVRSWVGGGDSMAGPRLAEQREAKELLATMEKLGPAIPMLQHLKATVLEHAAQEEAEVLPALKAAVEPDRLATLGAAYTLAKAMAPTHPYPMAPNTFPGNVLLLPAIAIVDRTYDAIWSVLRKASA